MTLVYMVIAWSAGIVLASIAGAVGLAGPGIEDANPVYGFIYPFMVY